MSLRILSYTKYQKIKNYFYYAIVAVERNY